MAEAAVSVGAVDDIGLAQQVDGFRRRYEMLDAEATARDAMARFPDSAEVSIALGRVLLATHRPTEAAKVFSQAEKLAPGDDRPVVWQIAALSRQRAFADAVAIGSKARERFARSPLVRVALGRTFLDSSQPEEALPHLSDATIVAPADIAAVDWYAAGLAELHRWTEAQAVVRGWIAQNPASVKAHYRLGRILLEDHRFTQAIECFDTVLGHDPEHASALEWRVTALRRLYRFDEAEAFGTEATTRVPGCPRLHVECAWVFSDQDREDEAVARAEQALAINPRDSWALRSRIDFLRWARRFDEAEQAATEALELRPDDPDVHTTAAWVFSDQDQEDEAVARAEQALAINPRDSSALRSRIAFLRSAGRFDEAQRAVAEALELRPDDPDVHTAAAWVFSVQDREDEAVARAEQALAINPRDSWALRSRIDFLRWARRFDEAEQAATEALELRPDDPDVHTTAAWVFSDQDQEDEAVAQVEQALAINPRDSWALRSRIAFLRSARRFDQAEQAATEALELRPDDPDVHTTAAWVFSDQDEYDKAITHLQQALAINPRHSSALRSRIEFLRSAGRFDEAEQAATEALELRPNDPDIRIELGRVHDDRLAFDAALASFAAVLDHEPDHVDAHIARSASLRSLRRCPETEREITRLCRLRPTKRDLKTELGWIHHDERRLAEARRVFRSLFDTAVNDRERAGARHGLGWVAFAAGEYAAAEQEFRAAIEEQPKKLDYELGLAWALTRQSGEGRWREAERIAYGVAELRPESSAHVCLGVLAFKHGSLASAEYHLKKALEIDPYHGSHTDLGALYIQMARYVEAEAELLKAVERDWYDTAAHIELGNLYLQLGDERLPDAEREFRQALAADPASGGATIGLAQALAKAGDEAEAEATLRQVLSRQAVGDRWRTHLALARLLVQRGDKQQNSDLHTEAYAEAQRAIGLAPDSEADPHFVAGVAHHRMGSLTAEARGHFAYRRRAMHHLRECLKRDASHIEAERNLHLLEREIKATAPAVWGGYAVGAVSLLLLAMMWVMFFFSAKVTITLLSVNTPVLVGLFTVSTLLPALIRLKLPGFEADLQAGTGTISPGPTGEVTFGPGRFTVATGPTGQLPRHE